MTQLSHPLITQEYLRQQCEQARLRAEGHLATRDRHNPIRTRAAGAGRTPPPLRKLAAAVIRMLQLPWTPAPRVPAAAQVEVADAATQK